MLKQRVITAIVLVAIVIAAVFLLPSFWFAIAAGVFFSVGAWEWSRLAHFETLLSRFAFTLIYIFLYALVGWFAGISYPVVNFDETIIKTIGILAAGWWLIALSLVVVYPRNTSLWAHRWSQTVMGLLVLLPSWLALVFLQSQQEGYWLIIILIASVACADIGAYFVGRQWGKNKLAPNVSPGKSREGMYGGLAASMLFALILAFALGDFTNSIWLLAIILPTSLISVLGDLLESMCKRERGIKDSGTILPGHGGVLDRIDSITAAAPIFVLMLILTGWQL